MGNTQIYIPRDIFKLILEHLKTLKDIEFHEFHNIACTSIFFNKLIPVKLLQEKYNLYYPFLKTTLIGNEPGIYVTEIGDIFKYCIIGNHHYTKCTLYLPQIFDTHIIDNLQIYV